LDPIEEIKEKLEDHGEKLQDHSARIKKIEDMQVTTLQAISGLDSKHEQRLRDVKVDLQERITNLDTAAKERDSLNSERLDNAVTTVRRVESKIDSAVKEVRETPPTWVGPLIGVLLAAMGWLVEYLIFKG